MSNATLKAPLPSDYHLVNLRDLFVASPALAEKRLDDGFALYSQAFPDPAERQSRESLRAMLTQPDGGFIMMLAYGDGGLIGGRTMTMLDVKTAPGHRLPVAAGEHLFIAQGQKRKGIGTQIVATTNQLMGKLGAGLIISEQNDPHLMTRAEIARDHQSGIGPHARLQFWKKQGYVAFDAPYAQPSLDGGQPVWYLRLCCCVANSGVIPASAGFDGKSLHADSYLRIIEAYFSNFVDDTASDPTFAKLRKMFIGRQRVELIDIEGVRRFHQARPDLVLPPAGPAGRPGAVTDAFPLIDLAGEGEPLGRAMGEALRPRIQACWDFYRRLFAAEDETLRKWAGEHEAAIAAAAPTLAAEMRGIAAGSGLAEWQIVALNSRTEILRRLDLRGECTSFFLPGPRLLAQSWDWASALESLAVVLRIARPDGSQLLTFTEPGILAKIGLNSAGVGVCLNILRHGRHPGGVPVHVLLRLILESPSAPGALARLRSLPSATASHLLIADAAGAATSIELADGKIFAGPTDAPFLAHTNHYLWTDIAADTPEFSDSHARLQAATDRLAGAPQDAALAHAVLADCGPGEGAISCAYVADDWLGDVGTVAALILDLRAGRLSIRKGPSHAAPWREILLPGFPPE